VRLRLAGVPGPELVGIQAVGSGFVSDVVVGSAAYEGHLAGDELHRAALVVEPHPASAADHGVDGELDGADQSQSPWWLGDRAGEDSTVGAGTREAVTQYVHVFSISETAFSCQIGGV